MKKFIKSLFSGMIVTSVLLNSINVFASQTQVVKISIGNTIANVNGNDTTLSIAPYIQKSSGDMMIPLRFVSTSLGIDENNIQYNPNTKEISIFYDGKTVKFVVGTNKLIIDGKDFSMLLENKYPIYTEIKNGSTFIPLRSLELAFDNIKIDWENSTKTAILKNELEEKDTSVEQYIIKNNSNSLMEEKEEILSEQESEQQEAYKFLKLINDEREKNGLQPVELSNKLMETAKQKRIDMEENEYFAHTNPNGYNMARELGIAENCTTVSGVENAFKSWLNSTKGHREIMLEPNIKYIGISTYSYSVLHLSSDDKWAN